MSAEDSIYQDQAIRITPTRVIVGKQTHLVADLKSAGLARVPGTSRLSCLLLAIGLTACGLAGYGVSAASTMNEAGFTSSDAQSAGLVLLAIAVAGIVLFAVGAAIPFLQKPRYALTLARASGQYSVLVSPKKDYIQTVVDAVNQAIGKHESPIDKS